MQFRPLQNEGIKREVETIPAEVADHLHPVEHQMIDQPDTMEQGQAEELTESVFEDALSDITLTEEQMDNVEETGVLGAPGPAENTESVETELPAPVVIRSGQTSKVPEQFRDYICSEVKDSATQALIPSAGVHLIPDADIAKIDKSSPLAAALEYQPQREIRSFVNKQRNSKVNYKIDLEAILTEMLCRTRDNQWIEYGSK